MTTYKIYAKVEQLHKVEVTAESVKEALDKAVDLFSDDTCYETGKIEIASIEKVEV
jgi:hypothetical protein